MPDDKLPPLVTGRSPSLERAQKEHDHPSPTGEADAVARLNRLVEAEEGAARACLAGAEAVTDGGLASRLREEASQHRVRATELGRRVEELGGSPPRPEECGEVLDHGASSVARAADVEGELAAMRAELAALHAAGR